MNEILTSKKVFEWIKNYHSRVIYVHVDSFIRRCFFFTFKTFLDSLIALEDFNNYLITVPVYSFPFNVPTFLRKSMSYTSD